MSGSQFAIQQAFLNRFGTGVLSDGTLKTKEDLINDFGIDMINLIIEFEKGGIHIA